MNLRMTDEAFAAHQARVKGARTVAGVAGSLREQKPAQEKPRKYRNVLVEERGKTFGSKRERARYHDLLLLQYAGHIKDLRHHPVYAIEHDNFMICEYEADFDYTEVKTGAKIVEDVKPEFKDKERERKFKKTQAWAMFSLKRKLMKCLLKIDVRVV